MGYTVSQAQAFIQSIAPYVKKYAKEYGYKVCSPIIAQAICESGITSKLAVNYFNYFGLKAGSSKVGAFGIWDGTVVNMTTKEEYTAGTLTTIKDYFRVYKADAIHTAIENGIRGYFEFIGGYKRYANLKACTTPKQYLQTIVADKYCTSTTYVNTCMNIINKYSLTIYDDYATDDNTYITGNVYTTQTDLNIRTAPNGEKAKFGMITSDAKKHGKFDEYGNAVLCEGTRVTCKGVTSTGKATWMKINSGYICAKSGEKVYVK